MLGNRCYCWVWLIKIHNAPHILQQETQVHTLYLDSKCQEQQRKPHQHVSLNYNYITLRHNIISVCLPTQVSSTWHLDCYTITHLLGPVRITRF